MTLIIIRPSISVGLMGCAHFVPLTSRRKLLTLSQRQPLTCQMSSFRFTSSSHSGHHILWNWTNNGQLTQTRACIKGLLIKRCKQWFPLLVLVFYFICLLLLATSTTTDCHHLNSILSMRHERLVWSSFLLKLAFRVFGRHFISIFLWLVQLTIIALFL